MATLALHLDPAFDPGGLVGPRNACFVQMGSGVRHLALSVNCNGLRRVKPTVAKGQTAAPSERSSTGS